MNDQPFAPLQSDIAAHSAGADLPFPTIEPELIDCLATIDDPIVDAAPAAAFGANTIEFTPTVREGASVEDSMSTVMTQEVGEPGADGDLVAHVGRPISSVMDPTLWTVHAEDTIEKVEEILGQLNLNSAPVVGSNGAIIGMIGHHELAQFHVSGKNAKVVQAWEIARIKIFEVSPGDTLEDVAKLMTENNVENISVTEMGRLKGIVSAQGLLTEMLKVLPDAAAK
ncbi:MAG: CBS domain-containing protein [Pseudomonadota bacterium]